MLAFHLIQFGDRPWYRHVAAMGGVLNVLMMMVANLIGFVIGLDGMKHLAAELFGTLKGALAFPPPPLCRARLSGEDVWFSYGRLSFVRSAVCDFRVCMPFHCDSGHV